MSIERLRAGAPFKITTAKTAKRLPTTIIVDSNINHLKKVSSSFRPFNYADTLSILSRITLDAMLNKATTNKRIRAASIRAESYKGIDIISP